MKTRHTPDALLEAFFQEAIGNVDVVPPELRGLPEWVASDAFVELRALNADLISLLRDVVALLPVAARLHPQDLFKLQTRIIAILEKAKQS